MSGFKVRVEVTIKENTAVEPASAPSQEDADGSHLMMEGYKTKFGTGPSEKLGDGSESDDDDDFPTLRF
ncbi:hypothetical protein N0V88_005135 [Collariella sp. IMI 366227]|nr:hypothetical protein N0V88_005135 [Collariella sp. IMI 366227]